ncbi:hypothetical protein PAHAL_3G099400 [Panicum hallii]|jgi:hypothetical protein|uniref:Reverse transcriptase zinc-binding domain-containing protein n=1 Tax=Panicum hallii TaxID=206008 RepID=A0A2S3H7K0_9POAL|nr:hypothetical protein PAHAL_3G099400 [Panicum hallii]
MALMHTMSAGFATKDPETADHLLVNCNCSFAKIIWWNLLSWMDCPCSFTQESLQLHTWWDHLRKLQAQEKRRGFDTLFMLIIWALWKERNNRLFQRQESTVQELQDRIKLDIKLWIEAGASRLGCLKRE